MKLMNEPQKAAVVRHKERVRYAEEQTQLLKSIDATLKEILEALKHG